MGNLVALTSPKEISAQLSHRDPRSRSKARQQLIKMGPEAVPVLLQNLDSRDWRLRWESCKALGAIGDQSSAAALMKLLQDEDTSVRWAAMSSLIRLGRAAIHPLMLAITQDFHSARLRQGAHHVLHALFDQGLLTPAEIQVFRALEGATTGIQAAGLANKVLIEQYITVKR